MPRIHRPVEGHLTEVSEQLVLGQRILGDRAGNACAHLLGGPPTGYRETREAFQELRPELDGPIGEVSSTFGVPVEVGERVRSWRGWRHPRQDSESRSQVDPERGQPRGENLSDAGR